jgi:DNA-binding MarR family transcriptional regulator
MPTPLSAAEEALVEKSAVEKLDGKPDTRFLQSLLGYNARRVALRAIEVFIQRMAPLGLRPVEFSVLSVIHHNPGVNSRQICAALGLQPPNLVPMLSSLEKNEWLERQPHPQDKRAQCLFLTQSGKARMKKAEALAQQLESEAASHLSAKELAQLQALLIKAHSGR